MEHYIDPRHAQREVRAIRIVVQVLGEFVHHIRGASSVFAIFPEEQFVIAILTNSEHADYKKLMDTAVRALMN